MHTRFLDSTLLVMHIISTAKKWIDLLLFTKSHRRLVRMCVSEWHRNLNIAFMIFFKKATKHSYHNNYDRYTSSSAHQFRSQTLENKNFKYTGCKNQSSSMNQHFNFHLSKHFYQRFNLSTNLSQSEWVYLPGTFSSNFTDFHAKHPTISYSFLFKTNFSTKFFVCLLQCMRISAIISEIRNKRHKLYHTETGHIFIYPIEQQSQRRT